MKNKKLTLQQQKNMVKARSHRTAAYDRSVEALVIAHRGKTIECLYDRRMISVQCSRTFDLVVGDVILLGLGSGVDPEILEMKPRNNSLYRIARDGHKKSLAANIDLACVVLARTPEPWTEIIAQYYTHLKILNIDCCFLINKIDQGLPNSAIQDRLTYFQEMMNVSLLKTSSYTGEGLNELEQMLQDKKSIIIGPSGVGKSSLLEKILHTHIKTGKLSNSEHGCHTTSVSQLYVINENTQVIDSPGIRQLSMESLSQQDLLKGFEDFKLAGCRFKDCDHIDSKGCRLKEAIDDQKISNHRYEDYLYLRKKFVTPAH
jgi:ribosome biogenesis GTPase